MGEANPDLKINALIYIGIYMHVSAPHRPTGQWTGLWLVIKKMKNIVSNSNYAKQCSHLGKIPYPKCDYVRYTYLINKVSTTKQFRSHLQEISHPGVITSDVNLYIQCSC